jgi:carboxymethylenebutenolidase
LTLGGPRGYNPRCVRGEGVTYPGGDQPVQAYLAYPATDGPWPAVVLIRALLSAVASVEALARECAEHGYLALAPNHYANDALVQELSTTRILKGIQVAVSGNVATALRELPEDERPTAERVVRWWDTRDDAYVRDLVPAFSYLRERADVRAESLGVIGFGGGGGLTGRLITTGLPVQAAVLFAGRLPPVDGDALASVRCPVLAHYGGQDREAARVPGFQAAMVAHARDFSPFIYPGLSHLFFDEEHEDYEPSAATLAWERTWEFLHARLQ